MLIKLLIEQGMSDGIKAAHVSLAYHYQKQYVSNVSPLHLIASLFDHFCPPLYSS